MVCTTALAHLDIDEEELDLKGYGGLGVQDELPDLLSDLWWEGEQVAFRSTARKDRHLVRPIGE
jgi:hypothetical protein